MKDLKNQSCHIGYTAKQLAETPLPGRESMQKIPPGMLLKKKIASPAGSYYAISLGPGFLRLLPDFLVRPLSLAARLASVAFHCLGFLRFLPDVSVLPLSPAARLASVGFHCPGFL